MKKINILFVITSLSGGGAERNSVSLANLFKKNGYKTVVVCTKGIKNDYGLDGAIPLRLIRYDDSERYKKLLDITKEFCINTVILPNHWQSDSFKDIKWFKTQNIKVVAQEHSMFFFPLYTNQYSLFKERLEAYKAVDALTCLSTMDVHLWKLSGIYQVCYVPNLTTVTDDTQVTLNFKARDEMVIVVGRLSEIKGLYRLPYFLEKIHKLSPTTKFCLFGDFGSKLEKVWFFNELRKRNILNSVDWQAFNPNVIKFMKKAKFLFIPSLIEGSPMVILEARQVGTPSLMLGLDYIDNALNGVLHTDCEEDFIQKVDRLLHNERYWTKYSKDAQSNLKEWQEVSILSKWEELLSQIHNCDKADSQVSEQQEEVLAMKEFYRAMDFVSAHHGLRLNAGNRRSLLNLIFFIKKIKLFLSK